jgi:ArsR family transcriptional regulator, arsenate/arsenite/antimonite-responsive transcriptional repressor / arsenate reductase (thioredoxin)
MAHSSLTYPPVLLSLLAHRLRWKIVMALAQSDRRVQELVQFLKQPPNLVSYHLKRLAALKLISQHRSAADHRDIYYTLDLEKLRLMYLASGQALHPGLGPVDTDAQNWKDTAPKQRPRVLFLCTHNSARSQMAEALLRHLSARQVDVFSAGSEPTEIHPLSLKVLTESGIPTDGLRTKHFNEFQNHVFDYVITVCDRVRESCPIFPGDPDQIHWSFPDPAAVRGEARRYQAFKDTATQLTTRINFLLRMIDKARTKNFRF